MSLDATAGLLPGLLPALYRGIAFDMPDTTTRPGRRIAEHLFPGLDHAAYDDLGAVPEELSVSGVIIGDDHAAQAQRLRAAFARPGPARLVHPWFGPLTVLALEPAEISLATNELRLVRFSANFTILRPGRSRGRSGTGASISSIAVALTSAAFSAGGPALGSARRRVRRLAALVRDSPLGRSGLVVPETGAADALGTIARWAKAAVDARAAAAGAARAPVAPAAEAGPIDTANVQARVRALHQDLRITAQACAVAAEDGPAEAPLTLRCASILIAEAARLFVHDTPDDRAHAIAVRDGFATVLRAIRGGAIATDSTTGHHEMERQAALLEAAIAADINEIIGRLPRTWAISLDTDSDAWLIAHHLFGDTPDAVEAGYSAIVDRNRLRHPASIDAGSRLEIER